MTDLKVGSEFAGHRIEGVAGSGGMGTVYRATHLALDHVVALKVISRRLAADPTFRERFKRESRAAVSIRHPNVVPIHHAGEEDGLLFVTMDLIEGQDLRELIAERRLDLDRVASLITQIGAALDAAHARGIVHRDIKPANVLIGKVDGRDHVYLTDFGLAKRMEGFGPSAEEGMTETGSFIGTLDYVSPEQIQAERVDALTDVYALGCVLFEMLTGSPPFGGTDNKVAKMYAHVNETPPTVSSKGGEPVPQLLEAAIARSLSKQPEERQPSAGDLARAAAAAIEGRDAPSDAGNVAVGSAAPTRVFEAIDTETVDADLEEAPTTTQESPAPEGPTASYQPVGKTEVASSPSAPPEKGGGRRPRGAILAGLGAAAVLAAAVLIGTGGGDDATPGGSGGSGGQGNGGSVEPADAKLLGSTVVDGLPVGIAADADGAWVASRSGNKLTRIDINGDQVGEPSTAALAPEGIATSGNSVYVVAAGEDKIKQLGIDGGFEAEQPVGAFPRGVAVRSGEVWVTNGDANTVSIFGAGGLVPIELAVDTGGIKPHGIALGRDYAWITNRESNTVSRISRDAAAGEGGVAEPFPVGENPKGVVVLGSNVWVANTDGGNLTRLPVEDPTNAETIDLDPGVLPRGLAAGAGSLWVADGSGALLRIDPSTGDVIDRIALDGSPEEVAVGGDDLIWVSLGDGESVARVRP